MAFRSLQVYKSKIRNDTDMQQIKAFRLHQMPSAIFSKLKVLPLEG